MAQNPDFSEFLDDDKKLKCTSCGACCLYISLYPDNPELVALDRGDGGCKQLKSNMKCRIYEDRPQACRTYVVSPNASDLLRAMACAGLKAIMDREIELNARSPIGKKWRLDPCLTSTSTTNPNT